MLGSPTKKMKIIIVAILAFAYATAETTLEQPLNEERIERFLRAGLERIKNAMKVGDPPLWIMDPVTGDHISWNKTQFEK